MYIDSQVGDVTLASYRYVHTVTHGTQRHSAARLRSKSWSAWAARMPCMRACPHYKWLFLGNFFQFTKNVCVTKSSAIVSPGTEHTCARKKYKRQQLITAQYSCSTRQNNTRISSVQTDAIITHKQSAVLSTTEKSVDEQSRHQCSTASFDRTDNLPIKFLGCAASNGMPQPSRRNVHIYFRHGATFAAWPCCAVLLCAAWHSVDVP